MRSGIEWRRWPLPIGVAAAVAAAVHACGGTTINDTTLCTPDETLCNGSCAALQKDPENCGACGTVCSTGTLCSQGQCTTSCGGGTTACGQSCVNTSNDRDNCGVCGLQCSAGEVCNAGQCSSTCLAGHSLCVLDGGAAYCAQTSSDNDNCGACFVVCGPGHVCANGVCSTTCASSQTYCAGDGGSPYCANTETDNANCGACGVACPSGELCKAGACGTACTSTQMFCGDGGYCATTASDPTNCGGCGVTCNQNQICLNGTCTCAPSYSSCFGPCVNLASDANNCGACGVTCSGACEVGRCVVTLASAQSVPMGLSLDSSFAYWANGGLNSGQVRKVPLAGGSVTTLATLSNPSRLALDSISLYVGGAELDSVPLGGGSTSLIASGLGTLGAVRVDSIYAYFVAGQNPGGVYRVPKSGGSVTTLATSTWPYDLVIDSTYAYWTDVKDGTLSKAPIAGGSVTVLASGYNGPSHLVTDGANVYWVNAGPVGAKIMQTPVNGGSTLAIFASFQSHAMGIAVDNTHVFWTNQNGDLMSIPIGGGTPVTLTSGESCWDSIAIDASSVYFTNVSQGTVKKVTPKK